MRLSCFFFLLFCLAQGVQAQQAKEWLPREDGMPIGAYYYPEHWDRDQWERDIRQLSNLGFEFTHFGEFAWAFMEPEEGQFNFGWLDTALAIAQEHDVKVIMCTPSPCPPQWLFEKHPETLAMHDNLLRNGTGGSRLLGSPSSKKLREYNARITKKLAKRYGSHSNVWGWQLDNEPHTNPLFDFSPEAQRAFRLWLQDRYSSLDSLNEAWGTRFWSQVYSDWAQIRLPNKKEALLAGNVNPHALLDMWRFQAHQEASLLEEQYHLLKAHIKEDQWVTTNHAYYQFLPHIDLWDFDYLDFSSHTMYLLSTYLGDNGGEQAHRLGSGLQLAFSNEMARSIKGYSGIMELQPGQINWGAYNPHPLPGAVRMWMYHNFAMGSRFICAYRFRQPLFGGEQYHKGIMETDGQTVAPGGEEYVHVINEMEALAPSLDFEADMPEAVQSRKVAYYYNMEDIADQSNYPQTKAWKAFDHHYRYYGAAKRCGSPVYFVTKNQAVDPAEYPVWVVPSAPIVEEEQVQIWKQYTQAGGHLIIGPRSGQKNTHGHLHQAAWNGKLKPLTGASVRLYDMPSPTAPSQSVDWSLGSETESFEWKSYGEYIQLHEEGVEVWARHGKENPYAQLENADYSPAVIHRKLGKGSVTYIGVQSLSEELEYAVTRRVLKQAGAKLLDQPPYFFTEWRDGVYVSVNYTPKVYDAPVPKGAEILFGSKNVAPAGVCIWKEKKK